MATIDELYISLADYMVRLQGKFVDIHIPTDPAVPPSQYELDVRSYCLLSHAAFEDFVERVVLHVVSKAVDSWIYHKKVNSVVILLVAWSGKRLSIDEDEKSPETRCFDYLRPLIEEAKSLYSIAVHNNHGVSKLYLRNLLTPAGIDLKQDVNLLNSLEKLANGRGEYAHKGSVKSVMAPEDAKRYVADVLVLCEDIRDKAKANML